MTVCNLSALLVFRRPGMCLLGLDPGRKVIGVAVSDPGWKVASPLTGIVRTKFEADAKSLVNIIRERDIGALVVGLPKDMDGTEGPAAQAARSFVSLLARKGQLPDPGMPVVFWDERFSTVAVTRFMLDDDMSRRRRKAVVDKTAAAYILQGALDALANAAMRSASEQDVS